METSINRKEGKVFMVNVITAQEAMNLIEDKMTVGVGGFGAYAAPDYLLKVLADRYKETKHPEKLTVVCGISPGDNTKEDIGLNRLAIEGLLDTVIAGHFGNPPKIAEMIGTNQVAGFAVPMGVIIHLLRAAGGHKPGVLTHVGLGTFADPRIEGCKANQKAIDSGREIVELTKVDGKDYLIYKTFPLDACLIRGTYADEDGNISMEEEAIGDYALQLAAATHASGGKVIVQVKNIVKRGSLNPKAVRIHHSAVDYVVKCEEPEIYHRQGYAAAYRPELTGAITCPTDAIEPMEQGNRKVIARRGAMELKSGVLINLGIGIPSGVGVVANEESFADQLTMSLESGPQGGVPVEGLGFGAAVNAEAIYPVADMFDLYDGGILDMTFLGAAEIDGSGNVNVSRFGTRCTGPGGFVNISQNTKKVYFVGTFTAGGLKEEVKGGKLTILQEGKSKKFKKQVQQITFSGDYARESGQEITFITERAVLKLTEKGIMLTEIAPGVDLQKDILDQMEFEPLIAEDLKLMDAAIFHDETMGFSI